MSDPRPPLTPSRALVLNIMFSVLVSVAVFVVVSWLVIVPQLARQEVEIRGLRAELDSLRAEFEAEGEAAAAAPALPAAAPGPAAPAAPAAAPAPPAPAHAAAAAPAPAAPVAPAPAAPAHPAPAAAPAAPAK